MKGCVLNLAVVLAGVMCLVHVSRAAEIVSPVIPDGLGVNIHFTDPRPGDMEMFAATGMKFIRMDFDWARIEKEPGVYDFTPYERLLDALDEHGIRALLILDYANPLYDDNRSPDTDEGRAAFARWAAAGAKHFAGRGVLWEMYNEPNIAPFWRPKPNTDDYIKLALAVGEAIRTEAPGEIYVGPATSGVDLPFLEACFTAGLLDYWDAITVHPYRQQGPETVEEDYRKLRLLIAKHAPPDKHIPIYSGEWGYSSIWAGFDDERQGKMLPRQWLINLANDVNLNIWYDWHDDGPDEKEPEHHFGTVRFPYHEGRDPVYDPKPAYVAAKTLVEQLRGFRFNKRLALESPDDYMFLFTKDDDLRIVAWTHSRQPRAARLPASPGTFSVVSHLGEKLEPVGADEEGITITLSDAPVYITPDEPNDLLRLAVAIERAPMELEISARQPVKIAMSVRNVLDRPVHVTARADRSQFHQAMTLDAGAAEWLAVQLTSHRAREQFRRRLEWDFEHLGTVAQETVILTADPLRLTILPRIGMFLPIRIENPSGVNVGGQLTVRHPPGAGVGLDDVRLEPGQKEVTILRAAPPGDPARGYSVSAALAVEGDKSVVAAAGRFVPIVVDGERFELRAEGDEKTKSEQRFEITDAPDGLPAPGASAARIEYLFDPGWKYICFSPKPDPQPIDGKPARLGLWVKGDGSGNIVRMRFVDSTGQTFQPDGPKLTFDDWRYVEFPLTGVGAGFWGGVKDGVVHYPIRLETIFLVDSAARQETGGTVYISSPTLVYSE